MGLTSLLLQQKLNLLAFLLLLLHGACAFGSKFAAPRITVVENVTDTKIVASYNGTLLVVAGEARMVTLHCNASYPVTWTLSSLEHPWVDATHAERRLTDFTDASTYTFGMKLTLKNANGRIEPVKQISLVPGEFTCQSAAAAGLTPASEILVVWEGQDSFWPDRDPSDLWHGTRVWRHTLTNRSALFGTKPLLIPCYTVNMRKVSVALYNVRKVMAPYYYEPLELLASSTDAAAARSALFRFEPYVGFFVNASQLEWESSEKLMECQLERHPDAPRPRVTIPGHSSFIVKLLLDSSSSGQDPGLTQTAQAAGPSARVATTPKLSIARVDSTRISCCLNARGRPAPGVNDTPKSVGFYSVQCSGPLSCRTKMRIKNSVISHRGHEMGKNLTDGCVYLDETARDGQGANATDRTIKVLFVPNTRLHICYLRKEFFFHLDDLNYEDVSHLLEPTLEPNSAKLVLLNQHPLPNGFTLAEDVQHIPFHEGESAYFRCVDDGYFFADGVVWEARFKNSTTLTRFPQEYDSRGFQISVTRDLDRVSCHVPLWNSTGWVTRTARIGKVEASSPPSSADGRRRVTEDVEFFVGESKLLVCDFVGHPRPGFTWRDTYRSKVYGFIATYDAQNITVFLNAAAYVENSTLPIPTKNVTCIAHNAAGSATKVFRIRAKRPIPPEVGYPAGQEPLRARSPALFLHEEGQFLTCVLLEGLPRPEFRWEKDGVHLSATRNSERYEIRNFETSSVLTFKGKVASGVGYEDEGEYTCEASNVGGSAQLPYHVKVVEPPAAASAWLPLGIVLLLMAAITLGAVTCHIRKRRNRAMTRQ